MRSRRRGLVVQMTKHKVLLYLLPTISVQVVCNLLFLSFSSTTTRCSNGNNNEGNLIFDVVARPQQQQRTSPTNATLGSPVVRELLAGSNQTTTTATTTTISVDSTTPHDEKARDAALVVGEATFLVSRQNLTARFPAQSFRRLAASAASPSSQQQQRQQQLITGVLSRAPNALQRQAIRDTWGYGHDDDVFFLVAGPWEDVADEFILHGDLVWFDHPDEYYQITWSVMGFMYLVQTKIKTFGHLFKTDDDSYVKLEDLEQQLLSSATTTTTTIDYGGDCLRGNQQGRSFYQDGTYPDYAAGYGYHLSSSFVSCIVHAMVDLPSINVEDANVGVFAHYCHVPCTTMAEYYAHRPDGWVTPQTFLIQHRVKTVEDMESYHRLACATANVTNAGCRLPRWTNNGAAGANSTDDEGTNATWSIA